MVFYPYFDKVDDKVKTVATVPHGIGTGDFTYEATIKLETYTTSSATGLSIMASTTYNPVFIVLKTSGNLGAYWSGTKNFGTQIPLNTWKHVVMVRSSGVLKAYIDGVLCATTFTATNTMPNGIISIGENGSGNGDLFNGGIKNVRMYNRALSDSEISQNAVGSVTRTGLLAEWLMNEGSGATISDTSGNGYHATLTGGTWLDDGTGGGTTPTVHEGESILSSASNLTAESNLIYNGESTLSSVSNLTAEATVIQSAEAILSAISTLTAEADKISPEVSVDLSASSNLSAIGSIIVNGETVLSANSELTAIGEIVSMDISVDLSARASLTVEGSVIQSGEASLSAVSQLEALASLVVSGEVELSAISQLTVYPEKDLVGVIWLKGKRELYVYLKGKRELEVRLKGGLNVTEYNQNFTMESGDSKILLYAMDDDLTGATIKWEMYQRGQTEPLINKTGTFTNSNVQIELVPADTQGVYGTYRYELHCELLGKTSTLAKGVITLE